LAHRELSKEVKDRKYKEYYEKRFDRIDKKRAI
jgi:hypothetical protein